MARYTGAVCRLCRREGEKLFLKGTRCIGSKCAFSKRAYVPGAHAQKHAKISNYGIQLREKQKAKRAYGLIERQFRGYFEKAERLEGRTGENLLRLIERRLDNVVYRFGFTASRSQARQLVRHNHFLVNGEKVNIPSYSVKEGCVIEVKEKSRKILAIRGALEQSSNKVAGWLELHAGDYRGIVKSFPTREEIGGNINEQLIVELYSK